ncbi:MAG: thioredoxin domain-containing protein [Lachnospira sp.]|nr:thioredoxin domain-containing protein [Lachnospira sp.]
MSNHLKNQTSPYLLQHAENPVEWYPWGEEAFARAKSEDKPIFLSIGYSTCHWCHVMAHESFEDEVTAKILNEEFIAIKVDKEERPDIDSIYMSICQTFTGSGGWPTSIFMTADQKAFFAGTYFPKERRFGMVSFKELLYLIIDQWKHDREKLLETADTIVASLNPKESDKSDFEKVDRRNVKDRIDGSDIHIELCQNAVELYRRTYDEKYGGFGNAPKFPAAHNLIFLINDYEKYKKPDVLDMVEHTLLQMYRGGLFDHVGYGFYRYSTDRYFLVPHFEKMLYDNALLMEAYSRFYMVAKKELFREIAEKTADYILREMTAKEGGFYSAQDADSEGEEGKYYVFTPDEIIDLLGRQTGEQFNACYDITDYGNFEGKSIPNLLKSDVNNREMEQYHKAVYEYRKNRVSLHLDDKILTAWNGLMIAALCQVYRISRNENYRDAAIRAERFIDEKMCQGDDLYVSYRAGKCGTKGFLADYSNYIYGLLALYDVTLEERYMDRAKHICEKTIQDFWDQEHYGFYLYGSNHENMIMRPKETYDGAMPSGNSVMAYNLVRLTQFFEENELEHITVNQLEFCSREAARYPVGYAMFLVALQNFVEPPEKIVAVISKEDEKTEKKKLPFQTSQNSIVKIVLNGQEGYRMKNDQPTYYICKNHSCQPPTNQL